ncbi:putative F-box domain-containing protein [Rosa chinensis]|uniref:Putative F-box domain-containing protein n=1 Tax=Rosa chinensis TaxID=74649 RepID=A0A2P6S0Y9_ROSCH|nr:putative F-box protein At3g16210 isoform X2 [Rosa chinensis]PRQ52350.1 putative F-box domain-containing protein [Rosa chinensis]
MGDGAMVLKRAHTDFGDYEEDVIAEILARLPAKSLMRFRCVCKSWRALISDSYFVKKHLSYGERGITESAQRLIFMLDPPLALDCEALKSMEDYEALESIKDDIHGPGPGAGGHFAVSQLDFPVTKTISDFSYRVLVGACNGLVCVEVGYEAILLWNPCTRDSKVLPKPPRVVDSKFSNYLYGFGYDSASDDYKVIWGFACYSNGATVIDIFSLKTGSWRTVKDIGYVSLITQQGLFLNGALHWLYNLPEGVTQILSFDLGEEKFQKTIPLPYDDWFDDPMIHKNCLCVLNCPTGTNSFNIWMMKEYGVKESWTEVLQFSLENYVESYDDLRGYFRPVCILENGLVLIDQIGVCEDLMVLSDLKEKKFKHFVEVANDLEFRTVIYRETLVSPDAHTYKTNNVS